MKTTYALEVQFKAESSLGAVITFVYLFDKFGSEPNDFLGSLGFHDHYVKNLGEYSKKKEAVLIDSEVSLQELVAGRSGYFLYEGQSLFDSCEPSLVFVSKDVSWMSEKQYEELESSKKFRETANRPKDLKVYQNFGEQFGRQPYNITQPLGHTNFPGSADFNIQVYRPKDAEPLGLIEPGFAPAWADLPSPIYQLEQLPRLPVQMKYLPYFYEKLKTGEWAPVYITVPENFDYTKNIQPEMIPVFIRSNLPKPNGVRDIVKLDMPVVPIDPKLLNQLGELKKDQEKVRAKDAEKNLQESKRQGEEKAKQEALLKAVQEEEKQIAELEKKREEMGFKKVCVKWRLNSLVNRHFDNEHSWDIEGIWKGGASDDYECAEYKMVPTGADGQMPQEFVAKVLGVRQEAAAKLNKLHCKDYLEVVLNRHFQDAAFVDLVKKECNPAVQLVQTSIHSLNERSAAAAGGSKGLGNKPRKGSKKRQPKSQLQI
jgi:hypothetical protein